MISLTQIRRFLAVADCKSFHAASEQVHITQPALTQSIQKLEAVIGEPLFVRGSRGVELTAAGELLVPRARLMIKLGDDFLCDMEEMRGLRHAHVSVGVSPCFARELFPSAYSYFLQSVDEVTVDVVEGQTIELLNALEDGELDMALCGLYDEPEIVTTMEFTALCMEPYGLFARSGHPIFCDDADPVDSLTKYPWAAVDRELHAETYPVVAASKGLPIPRFTLQSHSLHVIMAIVCATDHIALLPRDFAVPEVKAGRARAIMQSVFEFSLRGGVFTNPQLPRSSALERMVAAMQYVCQDPVR